MELENPGNGLQHLDKIITEQPHALYFVQAISSDISHGWKDVSFIDLANFIRRMTLWIYNQLS